MKSQSLRRIFTMMPAALAAFLLAACGGGGGSATLPPPGPSTQQMGGAIQGIALNLTGAVTTLAGSALVAGSSDGTGAAATFRQPMSVTTDGTNLYVADTYNDTIRKIVIATGAVTTLAGQIGVQGFADGTGTAASFNRPYGLVTDGTNLYVADTYNDTIRKIVIATGAVTTVAGQATVAGHADGTGAAATFYLPDGITTDGTNLYVADTDNDTIRKIVIATGAVTTVAGQATVAGHADGTGSAATFASPTGVTTDGTNLYVADAVNDTIRKIVIATGAVTTVAGQATVTGSADGTGSAATFYIPWRITTDGANLYIVDADNDTIRRIVLATGAVTTIAGQVGIQGHADGTGSAATFYIPRDITTDGKSLYVMDAFNDTIRKIQ
ncbi:MAG: NHL repeat-containing protein [Acidiferrobacterales bacterium]